MADARLSLGAALIENRSVGAGEAKDCPSVVIAEMLRGDHNYWVTVKARQAANTLI